MGKVLLPIETKSREFLGKVWLSLHLISEGHSVLIGDKGPIYSRYSEFEPDVFIEKSAFYSSSHNNRMADIKESGGKIVFLDEEGGIFNSKERYIEKRSPELFQYFDRVFAWGQAPAEAIIENTPCPEHRIDITGNPRFDLLQSDYRDIYKKKSTELETRFGDFVLVNTNFGIGNYHSNRDVEEKYGDRDIRVEKRKEIDTKLIEYFSEGIDMFLNDSSSVNVIIRPHPIEANETYRRRFSGNDRVMVEDSGDVRSWIYASRAVVHNSCTTGVESVLLGTPTISFQNKSLDTSTYKSDLPNAVSDIAYTPNQLSDKLLCAEESDFEMSEDAYKLLKRYFHNIDQPAAPIITNTISGLVDDIDEKKYEYQEDRDLKSRLKQSSLGSVMKSMYYEINGEPSSRKKFKGISKTELESAIADLRELSEFPSVTVKRATTGKDVYWMSSE